MENLFITLLNRRPTKNEVLFFINNNYNFKQINQFILKKEEYKSILDKNREKENKILENYHFITKEHCKNNLLNLFKKCNRNKEIFNNSINELKNKIRDIYKNYNKKINNTEYICEEELNELLIKYFNNLSLIEVELNIINSEKFLVNSKIYINNILNE